ncbi:hypothetical protein [Acinetobacter pittii]|uniref:hypothetical protein n=1 Tax=Acinetobacter pittii TaxID=48296 RepID=UPI00388F027E
MSTAAELKKANEMTNFKKYKAKVFEALANDTYGLTVSQLATVCKLSAKTIKQILAELDVEKNGDVYLLMTKQPAQSTPHFPIYDNWLSKNMTTLRQATAHLRNNEVNDIIEVAGRLIWEASRTMAMPTQTINEIQNWVAIESIQAIELSSDELVVGANELAEFIKKLTNSEPIYESN